ncbi:MAG: hypothetical protein Fur0016_24840 [Anaerolineales bacterium]
MMPIFETTETSDPLGLWATTPQPEIVHFGIGDETASPPPDVPVFRVNLPGNTKSAGEAFESGESYFERVNAALDGVPDRLDTLVSQMQARQAAGDSVSFDIASLQSEPGPERDLLLLLEDASKTEIVSFSIRDESETVREPVSQAWQEARARFDALMEQINREVLHFAWVETNVAGQWIARSQVNWSGDTTTLWAEKVSEEQKTLHHRALNMAARSRNLKLRLFVTVASGAAKVTTLVAAGTPVLALPAIYQYVLSILKQVRQLQSVS